MIHKAFGKLLKSRRLDDYESQFVINRCKNKIKSIYKSKKVDKNFNFIKLKKKKNLYQN